MLTNWILCLHSLLSISQFNEQYMNIHICWYNPNSIKKYKTVRWPLSENSYSYLLKVATVFAMEKFFIFYFCCFFLMLVNFNAHAQQCAPLSKYIPEGWNIFETNCLHYIIDFPTCSESANAGYSGRGCNGGTRWYYNTRSRRCETFTYWGCGGNSNRYCTQFACQQRCRVFTT